MADKGRSCLKRVFGPLEVLLTISVVAVFAEVITEVVSRYILHVSLAWGSEVSQTLLVWITFIGAAVALFRDEHMAINIMLDKISNTKARKMLEFAGDAAILIFLIAGIIGGWNLTCRTWEMKTTTLQIPAGILYLAFPLGCLLMLPVVIRNIYGRFGKE